MKIILPKILAEDWPGPIYFLMGPVWGGGDWQLEACRRLDTLSHEECSVAIPRRYGEGHPLYERRSKGGELFPTELAWKRYYLEQAANGALRGCIIVWLPLEKKTEPQGSRESYALDTYGYLGEWRGRMMRGEKIRLALGAESDLPGLEDLIRDFGYALEEPIHVHSKIEEVVWEAIGIAGR